MAYYSKASMHCAILIHLFQCHTAESLLENQLKNINLVLEVTKHMVLKLQWYTILKGRNIRFYRLYTSLPLMNYLLEKDITAVGTLLSNRKGLSKEFVKTARRKEFSCEILWNADGVRMTLRSYVVKRKSIGLPNILLRPGTCHCSDRR